MDPFQQPGQGIGSNLLQGVGGIIDFGNGQATGATLLVELQPGAKIASFISRFALTRPGQDRDDCHHNTSTQEHDPSTPHPRIWARKWFEQNFSLPSAATEFTGVPGYVYCMFALITL